MSSTVSGRIQASVSLTTTFTSGTAGTATEINNVGTSAIGIGAAKDSGQQFAEVWSQTYSDVDSAFTLDLTALSGVGGRTVDFTTPGVRLIQVINSDPTAGNDINVGPGSSNGFAAPWPGTSAYSVVHGGMPDAGISDAGQPMGNSIFHSNCTVAGYVVDATHKDVKIDPGSNTITSLTVVIAG